MDKVVEDGYKANDSIIFQVESGYDDKIGNKIFKQLFNGHNSIKISKDSSNLKNIIGELSDEVIEIIKEMNIEYVKK